MQGFLNNTTRRYFMNSMTAPVRGVAENAKKYARNKALETIRSVVSPLAGTISFMFDFVAYLSRDPYAWRTPHSSYKKDVIDEIVREYPKKVGDKIFICRESLPIYAIRGRNRRVLGCHTMYRELIPHDFEREDFKKRLKE